MKYLKMLGLATVAAAALMGIVGTSSASATVLCKTELTSGCVASGWDYPAGTVGDASLVGSAILETTGGAVLDTCTGSTVKGTSENTGSESETVRSVLTTLTWEGCTKTTTTRNPGTGELHWISGTDNGTLITKNTEVTVSTIFGICVFGTGEALDMGTTIGGNPGNLTINTLVKKLTGALCPSEVRFTAKYVATEPLPIYVASS